MGFEAKRQFGANGTEEPPKHLPMAGITAANEGMPTSYLPIVLWTPILENPVNLVPARHLIPVLKKTSHCKRYNGNMVPSQQQDGHDTDDSKCCACGDTNPTNDASGPRVKNIRNKNNSKDIKSRPIPANRPNPNEKARHGKIPTTHLYMGR
ncbi:hypothetical protein K435DRAFT_795103 [Dendrothele bispora CBS 962.96]|uniref:Uncharacterized protein n=1 Tax=Dendrothele bispora (strain CBS 962.96) TaxID=1314807 RepID=A0A4V4HGK5_DENBC|nr:hypothetical protein K435DRAFT_795103 [Dendrothele bispora CBS 962.96]